MKRLLQVLAILTACTAGAQGTFQGIVDYSSPIVSSFEGTAGWSFRPVGTISVTHLGAFTNVVSDQGPVVVGLWSADGALLRSATVNTTGVLVNNSFNTPVQPIWLNSMEEYFLGAFSPSGPLFLSFYDALQPDNNLVTGAHVQFVGQAQNSSTAGLAFPGKVPNGEDAGWMAANFVYLVPEPGVLSLLLMGAALVFTRRFRRQD